MFEVKKALPVWGATMKNKWNQFAGFYKNMHCLQNRPLDEFIILNLA